MRFSETELSGAFVVDLDLNQDERGFFARSWCQKEFGERGLCTQFVQSNISFNRTAGIIRGLHFQKAPYEEIKLVRCTMGKIFDVIVDIRSESKTFLRWVGVELSADNRKMMYVPKGFAHGFQTLVDNSEVFYEMSEFFYSAHSDGIRWNDHSLGISWPIENPIVSLRDQHLPLFSK